MTPLASHAAAGDPEAGDPQVFEGYVIDLLFGGIVIDVSGDEVSIYGLGPDNFWEAQNVARPGIGDLIEVTPRWK